MIISMGTQRLWIITLILLASWTSQAQNRLEALLHTPQSKEVLLYKLTQEQASYLVSHAITFNDTAFFKSFVMAVKRNDDIKNLPHGHYLKVTASGASLTYDYIPVSPFILYILDNSTDLLIQIRDKKGNAVLGDLQVIIDGQSMPFDVATGAYRLTRSNLKGVLDIAINNEHYYYSIEKTQPSPSSKKIKKSIFRFRAVRIIVYPPYFLARLPVDGYKSIKKGRVQGSIFEIKYRATQWYRKFEEKREARKERKSDKNWKREYHSDQFTAYTFFSKIKYRLKDTVSFKVLLLKNTTQKWADVPLTAKIRVENETYFLGTCTPRHGSGYYYTFQLHDSMKFRPDNNYTIELIDKDSLDYADCSFRVEEYELQKSVFRIENEEREHIKGKPYEIKYIAKDENGLPMRDAKAEITVTARSIQNILPDRLFVPYQLWKYEFAVEDGVKTFAIPDSIFARADYNYTINTSLRNAENERKDASFHVNYIREKYEIREELSGDSIVIQAWHNDDMVSLPVNIKSTDRYGYYLSDDNVVLPYKAKINTHAQFYKVSSETCSKDINIENVGGMVSCNAGRSGDSVFINIGNTRNLPVIYQLYQRNKELFWGTIHTLDTTIAANEKDLYYIALQYIWAGKTVHQVYQIPLHDKLVTLKVDQPLVIYPGKETEITITALDYKDRPVKDMSILSYAYTAKFNSSEGPALPDFSSRQKAKYLINSFRETSNFSSNRSIPLNYDFWKKQMALDTVPGFRFIFPTHEIERIELPASDCITQLAPFVTDSGKLQGAHYVLINHVPVYFGFTEQKAPYSFEADAGRYHEIRIRTKNSLVVIDSFETKEFYKTMFTVDVHRSMKHVKVIPMPDSLTQPEINDYSNYVIRLNEIDTRSPFRFLSSPYNAGVFWLNGVSSHRYYYDYQAKTTLGPVVNRDWFYNIAGEYNIDFEAEPGFIYTFKPRAVKMVGPERDEQFIYTHAACNVPWLDEWIITAKRIDEAFREKPKEVRRNIDYTRDYNGNAQLKIEIEQLPKDAAGNTIELLNIIVAQPGNFDFINIYPGSSRFFSNIPAGKIDMLIIKENGIYRNVRNVNVQADGINFYRIKQTDTLGTDRMKGLDSFLNRLYYTPYRNHDRDAQLIMSKYLEILYDGPTRAIDGVVVDDHNEGVPGASIKVKGTTIGTITDMDGNFVINIPKGMDAALEITTFEFVKETFKIAANKTYTLTRADNSLQEVQIYSRKIDKRSYTGSLTTVTASDVAKRPVTDFMAVLDGSAPGVIMNSGSGQPGSTPDILIRGVGSLGANNAPLIVIDGAPYNGTLVSIDPSLVASTSMLKDAAATSLYGSRGANGVIVIITKKGVKLPDHIRKALEETAPIIPEDIMVSGLRNRFRDDAFWQPNLITDKNGKVSFKVKFPDDLTSWNTFVYATDDKMRTGQTSGNIKSFKPVSAALQVTQFLVEGDSANFIGKSVNYIPDTISVTNSYFINDTLQKETQLRLTKYNNEIIPVIAGNADSVKLKYLLTKEDGYFDGEEKSIDIMPRGVSVAKGAFLSLDGKDATVTIPAVNNKEPLYLSATASLIDIVLDEIEKVKNYQHLCNEQLSSKIIATLNQQRIYEAMKKPLPLNHKADVQKMINLLLQRQNSSKLWGWWGDGQSVDWISGHVLRALNFARDMKYYIGQLNFEHMVQPLVYQWERDSSLTDIQSLKLLHTAGMKIDYEKYIKRVEREKYLTLGEKLELIRFRQELKLPYSAKLLTDFKQEDIYGNIFWKDTTRYIYDNEVLSTLAAFKILQADTSIKINKNKVVNWFIQERKVEGWRNIYESSQLIEAIASHINLTDTLSLKPVLGLSGGLNRQITTFPYEEKIRNSEAISVHKTGATPVYFTWYQRHWDTNDTDLGANFIINSAFEHQSKTTDTLKAGEAVQLKVNVTVEKSAEFVMIDIPIPAGCSYNNKNRGYYGHEVHREYYKDRVSIFCEQLPKGTYTYVVDLLPRYTGTYTVNPAKAELMYFPVFYGREKIRKINIE